MGSLRQKVRYSSLVFFFPKAKMGSLSIAQMPKVGQTVVIPLLRSQVRAVEMQVCFWFCISPVYCLDTFQVPGLNCIINSISLPVWGFGKNMVAVTTG